MGIEEKYGSMPERLMGADCNSAGVCLRWFKSSSAQLKNYLFSFTACSCFCTALHNHLLV